LGSEHNEAEVLEDCERNEADVLDVEVINAEMGGEEAKSHPGRPVTAFAKIMFLFPPRFPLTKSVAGSFRSDITLGVWQHKILHIIERKLMFSSGPAEPCI
jgi:hypothetical protein